jgi:hypothetical protein
MAWLMTISSDPAIHRQREQQLVAHVQRLLSDDRLRIDTSTGNRSITSLIRDVRRDDKATDLKRTMSEMGVPDRELQAKMPVGEVVEVTLGQKRFIFFRQTVGRMKVLCVSPTRALIAGEVPQAMGSGEVQKLLGSLPPSYGGVPQTLVLMSTSGFTPEAHEMADRGAGRCVVLVEPNEAGGWTVTGPPEARSITELLDPEVDADKRQRARQAIDEAKLDLLQGGLSVEKLSSRTKLPAPLIESEMKAYAKATPGLIAKKLDGRLVMFREGSAPVASVRAAAGGMNMPLIDRMKALFSRKGDDEKKIAFLSERRAALSQQRDMAYEDMGALEQQEEVLKKQFKEAPGSITKKRVTSQLLQLRKDIERRTQLLGVLNQQINVVSTHLHNLELVQQGHGAHLPDTEEITADAVKAEEMLAELEANSELVGSVAMSSGATGLTAEEQALFEELEAENKQAKESAQASGAAPEMSASKAVEPVRQRQGAQASAPPPIASPARRSEPEAG